MPNLSTSFNTRGKKVMAFVLCDFNSLILVQTAKPQSIWQEHADSAEEQQESKNQQQNQKIALSSLTFYISCFVSGKAGSDSIQQHGSEFSPSPSQLPIFIFSLSPLTTPNQKRKVITFFKLVWPADKYRCVRRQPETGKERRQGKNTKQTIWGHRIQLRQKLCSTFYIWNVPIL